MIAYAESHMIVVELVSRIEEDVLYRLDGQPHSSISIGGQQIKFTGHGLHFVILDAKTGISCSYILPFIKADIGPKSWGWAYVCRM